jgi:O-acetyl-ADP-ribose deacetylase (regulator of RNase III)
MTPRLEAVHGDITAETTDAIVNAANPALARGAGVCGAIFAKAGPELDDACAALGGCPTGDAKATPGFGLPARWIVHAVGPVWHGGGEGEPELLASAYRRSLAVAAEAGARSIAFPAISTGIYGYPLEPATATAVHTCRESSPSGIELVRFVCFDRPTLDVYAAELARDA